MNKQFRFLIFGLVLALVGACATTQPGGFATGNPGESVKTLESALATARSNQVDVLAPGLFNDAQSAFIKAKQALDKGAKLTSIGKYVAQGNASLKKAEEIAQVSRTLLGKTNQARDKALKVGADRLGQPYMDVEKKYLKLTRPLRTAI